VKETLIVCTNDVLIENSGSECLLRGSHARLLLIIDLDETGGTSPIKIVCLSVGLLQFCMQTRVHLNWPIYK